VRQAPATGGSRIQWRGCGVFSVFPPARNTTTL